MILQNIYLLAGKNHRVSLSKNGETYPTHDSPSPIGIEFLVGMPGEDVKNIF